MSNRPRLRLEPEASYPAMPDHVRKEIVDLLADALALEVQENQGYRDIIVGSRSQNHNTTEENR